MFLLKQAKELVSDAKEFDWATTNYWEDNDGNTYRYAWHWSNDTLTLTVEHNSIDLVIVKIKLSRLENAPTNWLRLVLEKMYNSAKTLLEYAQ